MRRVCVFCGSKPGADPAYRGSAERLGKIIAERGLELVFGGGNSGLMGVVSQSALSHGAKVYGVIPDFLWQIERPADNLTGLEVVGSMRERKQRMTELSDAFVILPGGPGTLEEAFEVFVGNMLGQINKPAGFLDVNGYWDRLFGFFDHAHAQGFFSEAAMQMLVLDSNPDSLLEKLAQIQAERA